MIASGRRHETVRRRGTSALLVAIALLTGACAGGSSPTVRPSDSDATPGGSAAVSAAPSAGPFGMVPEAVLEPILADAASRTGAGAAAISVVEAKAMTWTTGALGCPSPGMMYTQVVSTGWQVIVSAAGTRIDYRTTGPGRFVVCAGATGG